MHLMDGKCFTMITVNESEKRCCTDLKNRLSSRQEMEGQTQMQISERNKRFIASPIRGNELAERTRVQSEYR